MKVLILDAAAESAVAAAQALGRNGVCVHAQSNKIVKETAVF